MNALGGGSVVTLRVLLPAVLLAVSACRTSQPPLQTAHPQAHVASTDESALSELQIPNQILSLPLNFGHCTGDLDLMERNRKIRALVVDTRPDFFYDRGMPRGVYYEALEQFEKFANQKLRTNALRITVTFIPVRPDQLESGLSEGLGDMIGTGIVVTPDREQRVAFSVPLRKNVKVIVVGGPHFGAISSLSDLSGREIYANPLAFYYSQLLRLSDELVRAGKPAIHIKPADKNLMEEDLIEMVAAGMLPATVASDQRAAFWSQVFSQIRTYPDFPLASEGQIAWVMRKNNPQLKSLVDEFVRSHAAGTTFGNVLLRRYLHNTKWVRNDTAPSEMKKLFSYEPLFKKYSAQYDFDYLMIAALGYQESMLDQGKRSPRGAVGIMQVIPKYAAGPPIGIRNVDKPENNINAGVKILHHIASTYFGDNKLDPMDRTLFTFAAYNAGPTRIARLRKQAQLEGLDPGKWFGNVDTVVAQDIGRETVQFVSNIYKYYVAYKLTLDKQQR